MERSLKRLLQIYPIMRKWTVLTNHVTPLHSAQNIIQTYNTNSTDHMQLEDIKPLKGSNCVRSKNVKTTYDITKILEMAATSYTNMSMQDAMKTMSTLFKMCRYMKNVDDVENHIGFVRLCEILNRNIRLMKTGDIIENLKIFTYLKVPNDTLLIQSLLQMIRLTVNEILLRDIIFIVFLLKKMESTPLRDALLIALPLVFEAQLPTKLDTSDIALLTSSLRFASEYDIQNPEIYDIIFKSLSQHQGDLDVSLARSIFYSLCHISYLPPAAFEVLSGVQNILVSKVKELNVLKIIRLLNKLTFAVSKNNEYSYKFCNETLIDTLIYSALSLNISFTDGISLLKLLNDLNYAHIPFLEYLAAKCFEEPNLLKDASYFKVSVFLEGFINVDYKPVFWDTIRDAILANKMENKIFNKSLIRFALHLTALDCYSSSLLSKVFSQDIRINEAKKNVYARELLFLYQGVKTLYPMYNGPWPSQDILEYATMLKPTCATYSFKTALERALGGPQYVCNDLRTKLGHYIDHVVVMRKGGYPIAINTDISGTISNGIYVEDIQTPDESQIILIFILPDTAYTVNSARLKSTWSLKIKSAEALTKSNTIAINSSFWLKLPEYEKIPYLMQAIKLKCENLSV